MTVAPSPVTPEWLKEVAVNAARLPGTWDGPIAELEPALIAHLNNRREKEADVAAVVDAAFVVFADNPHAAAIFIGSTGLWDFVGTTTMDYCRSVEDALLKEIAE